MNNEAKGPICPICKVRPIQKHRSSCDDRICGLINRHQVHYETMTPSLNLLVKEQETGNELLTAILGAVSGEQAGAVLGIVSEELFGRSRKAQDSGEVHSFARMVALRSAATYVHEMRTLLLEKRPPSKEQEQSLLRAAVRPWKQEQATLDAEIETSPRHVWAPPHEDDDELDAEPEPRTLPGDRICIRCDSSMESEPVRVGELLICAECSESEAAPDA